MIKEFIKSWDKHKDELKEAMKNSKNHNSFEYRDIVKMLFTIVINPDIEYGKFDTENMLVIDDGDYQGTQIFILHEKTYQPNVSEYVYTNTYYGSCSGCDTLLAIQGWNDDLPSEEQVKDYMTLCLHLLQRCNRLLDGDED